MFEISLLTKSTLLVGLVAIHSDCDSALVKAYSQVYNGMSRYIALIHSIVEGMIKQEVITLDYVNTKFKKAYYFTKVMEMNSIIRASNGIGSCPTKHDGVYVI